MELRVNPQRLIESGVAMEKARAAANQQMHLPGSCREFRQAECLARLLCGLGAILVALCLCGCTTSRSARVFLHHGTAALQRAAGAEAPTAEFSRCVETTGGIYNARGMLLASPARS